MSVALSSCGQSNDHTPASADAKVPVSFYGNFQSECKYQQIVRVENTNTTSKVTIKKFDDATCLKETASAEMTRDYKVTGDDGKGVYNVDLVYVSHQLSGDSEGFEYFTPGESYYATWRNNPNEGIYIDMGVFYSVGNDGRTEATRDFDLYQVLLTR
jgi:hypothetical protein